MRSPLVLPIARSPRVYAKAQSESKETEKT